MPLCQRIRLGYTLWNTVRRWLKSENPISHLVTGHAYHTNGKYAADLSSSVIQDHWEKHRTLCETHHFDDNKDDGDDCNSIYRIAAIWGQAASPPVVADPLVAAAHNRSTVFARWRQCARQSNTPFLEFHTTYRPKRQLDRFCRFCTVETTSFIPIRYTASPISPKHLPLLVGDLDPIQKRLLSGQPDPPPQSASRFSQPFFFWNLRSLPTDGQKNRPTHIQNEQGTLSIKIDRLGHTTTRFDNELNK